MELKKQSKEIYDQNEIQFNKLKKLKEDKDKIWKDYKKNWRKNRKIKAEFKGWSWRKDSFCWRENYKITGRSKWVEEKERRSKKGL